MSGLASFLTALAFIGSAAVDASSVQTRFKTLVQFGDSYTDIGRLDYFIEHNGTAPPVGWNQPDLPISHSGGYVWGHYVAESTNVSLYDYAVAGSVCSNKITPYYFPFLNGNVPSVLGYQVPAFQADSAYITPSGERFLDPSPDDTLYSMWIGTNDLGRFLQDLQVPGMTIADAVSCVFTALDQVYASGGRYFVIMNLIPLQLTPLYATAANGGVGPNLYWFNKPTNNLTAISYEMFGEVMIANQLYMFQTPFEVLFAGRYPGASFALMDMHALINEIYYNPTEYLSPPANVTGYDNHCDVYGFNCTRLPDPNSFLWFDPLHPSQRTDQIIAEKFVEVMQGGSDWATYYGAW